MACFKEVAEANLVGLADENIEILAEENLEVVLTDDDLLKELLTEVVASGVDERGTGELVSATIGIDVVTSTKLVVDIIDAPVVAMGEEILADELVAGLLTEVVASGVDERGTGELVSATIGIDVVTSTKLVVDTIGAPVVAMGEEILADELVAGLLTEVVASGVDERGTGELVSATIGIEVVTSTKLVVDIIDAPVVAMGEEILADELVAGLLTEVVASGVDERGTGELVSATIGIEVVTSTKLVVDIIDAPVVAMGEEILADELVAGLLTEVVASGVDERGTGELVSATIGIEVVTSTKLVVDIIDAPVVAMGEEILADELVAGLLTEVVASGVDERGTGELVSATIGIEVVTSTKLVVDTIGAPVVAMGEEILADELVAGLLTEVVASGVDERGTGELVSATIGIEVVTSTKLVVDIIDAPVVAMGEEILADELVAGLLTEVVASGVDERGTGELVSATIGIEVVTSTKLVVDIIDAPVVAMGEEILADELVAGLLTEVVASGVEKLVTAELVSATLDVDRTTSTTLVVSKTGTLDVASMLDVDSTGEVLTGLLIEVVGSGVEKLATAELVSKTLDVDRTTSTTLVVIKIGELDVISILDVDSTVEVLTGLLVEVVGSGVKGPGTDELVSKTLDVDRTTSTTLVVTKTGALDVISMLDVDSTGEVLTWLLIEVVGSGVKGPGTDELVSKTLDVDRTTSTTLVVSKTGTLDVASMLDVDSTGEVLTGLLIEVVGSGVEKLATAELVSKTLDVDRTTSTTLVVIKIGELDVISILDVDSTVEVLTGLLIEVVGSGVKGPGTDELVSKTLDVDRTTSTTLVVTKTGALDVASMLDVDSTGEVLTWLLIEVVGSGVKGPGTDELVSKTLDVDRTTSTTLVVTKTGTLDVASMLDVDSTGEVLTGLLIEVVGSGVEKLVTAELVSATLDVDRTTSTTLVVSKTGTLDVASMLDVDSTVEVLTGLLIEVVGSGVEELATAELVSKTLDVDRTTSTTLVVIKIGELDVISILDVDSTVEVLTGLLIEVVGSGVKGPGTDELVSKTLDVDRTTSTTLVVTKTGTLDVASMLDVDSTGEVLTGLLIEVVGSGVEKLVTAELVSKTLDVDRTTSTTLVVIKTGTLDVASMLDIDSTGEVLTGLLIEVVGSGVEKLVTAELVSKTLDVDRTTSTTLVVIKTGALDVISMLDVDSTVEVLTGLLIEVVGSGVRGPGTDELVSKTLDVDRTTSTTLVVTKTGALDVASMLDVDSTVEVLTGLLIEVVGSGVEKLVTAELVSKTLDVDRTTSTTLVVIKTGALDVISMLDVDSTVEVLTGLLIEVVGSGVEKLVTAELVSKTLDVDRTTSTTLVVIKTGALDVISMLDVDSTVEVLTGLLIEVVGSGVEKLVTAELVSKTLDVDRTTSTTLVVIKTGELDVISMLDVDSTVEVLTGLLIEVVGSGVEKLVTAELVSKTLDVDRTTSTTLVVIKTGALDVISMLDVDSTVEVLTGLLIEVVGSGVRGPGTDELVSKTLDVDRTTSTTLVVTKTGALDVASMLDVDSTVEVLTGLLIEVVGSGVKGPGTDELVSKTLDVDRTTSTTLVVSKTGTLDVASMLDVDSTGEVLTGLLIEVVGSGVEKLATAELVSKTLDVDRTMSTTLVVIKTGELDVISMLDVDSTVEVLTGLLIEVVGSGVEKLATAELVSKTLDVDRTTSTTLVVIKTGKLDVISMLDVDSTGEVLTGLLIEVVGSGVEKLVTAELVSKTLDVDRTTSTTLVVIKTGELDVISVLDVDLTVEVLTGLLIEVVGSGVRGPGTDELVSKTLDVDRTTSTTLVVTKTGALDVASMLDVDSTVEVLTGLLIEVVGSGVEKLVTAELVSATLDVDRTTSTTLVVIKTGELDVISMLDVDSTVEVLTGLLIEVVGSGVEKLVTAELVSKTLDVDRTTSTTFVVTKTGALDVASMLDVDSTVEVLTGLLIEVVGSGVRGPGTDELVSKTLDVDRTTSTTLVVTKTDALDVASMLDVDSTVEVLTGLLIEVVGPGVEKLVTAELVSKTLDVDRTTSTTFVVSKTGTLDVASMLDVDSTDVDRTT